jgi:hypothetical protein
MARQMLAKAENFQAISTSERFLVEAAQPYEAALDLGRE